MQFLKLSWIVAVLAALGSSAAQDAVRSEEQIKNVMKAFDRAWNAKDWEAVARLHTPNCLFTLQSEGGRGDPDGMIARVMARVPGTYQRTHPSITEFGQADCAECAGTKFLTPDIAIVISTARTSGPPGNNTLDTFVFQRIEGRWLIASTSLSAVY
jgi:uncharacterized protein (TIGR02246 family)